MAVPTIAEITRCRWSSDDDADRFSVENPATGKVITVIQGSGAERMNAAVESAHQAFFRDWRWRDRSERAGLLLSCAAVLEAACRQTRRYPRASSCLRRFWPMCGPTPASPKRRSLDRW